MSPSVSHWLAPIRFALLLACCCLIAGCGAARQRALRQATALASLGNRAIVEVERIPDSTELPIWKRMWLQPDPPSERTSLVLRRFNLEDLYHNDPDRVIQWLLQLMQHDPMMEEVHALAELAEKQAAWSHATGDNARATRLYATAIIHAYQFLFDAKLDIARNAYDPQFRSICDVYNRSLEGLLKEVCTHEGFCQGYQTVIDADQQQIDVRVRIEGRWRDQIFQRFELVNDYRTAGFVNQHQTYGLGAPLIAIREHQPVQEKFEKYYPPELTLPMTAFLHLQRSDPVDPNQPKAAFGNSRPIRYQAVLSLYDPLEQTVVNAENQMVPLESDITTPLAYGLRDPMLNKGVLATASFLDAEFAPDSYGMYMLEPYDPNKIPVVMVHGLWDGPTTWAYMFNDLRANSDLHKNFQFWFYSYPTAQPFWISAQQMRDDLKLIRDELDPTHTTATLDQMILVGHSMGGLVSTMQTIDSENHFWNIISDFPIEEFDGDRATLDSIRDTFVFKPNPSIARVITIATPFRGSDFANPATRWLGQQLIKLPSLVTNDFEKFARDNSKLIKDASFLTTDTSVDSLTPSNAIFAALAAAPQRTGVKTHNIVGRIPKRTFFASASAEPTYGGDGVVEVASAHRDSASSEIYLAEEHSKLHQHAGCILEVRRILLETLVELERIQVRDLPGLELDNPPHKPSSDSGPVPKSDGRLQDHDAEVGTENNRNANG